MLLVYDKKRSYSQLEEAVVGKVCQLTGARPRAGMNVSHSHRRTKRLFRPNIQTQRFWLESEKRWVRLRLSARAIKTINRRGADSVVAELRRKGVKV
jgi:large subunit ribosomal protein L28